MPVPNYQSILLPLLQIIGNRGSITTREARTEIARHFGLSKREKAESVPSGKQPLIYNRVSWAALYLRKAGLIVNPERGLMAITDLGKQVLNEDLKSIDKRYLERFQEFQAFVKSSKDALSIDPDLAESPESDDDANWRIDHIEADNFKSLVDFKMPLSKFSCLVGMNGVGKSTVLQFIDFLARQFSGDIQGWLDDRQWDASDINSKLTNKSNIAWTITLKAGKSIVTWTASLNRISLRCTTERIQLGHDVLLRVEDSKYRLGQGTKAEWKDISFEYQGSILSILKDSAMDGLLFEVKEFFLNLHSIDLLSPELLRTRTRTAHGNLGLGGEHLSSYIHEMDAKRKAMLLESLHKIYPNLEKLEVKSLSSGWKEIYLYESFNGQKLQSVARHINDGLLRICAILALLTSKHSFLLLDEIENGINPELIQFLIDNLFNCSKQILVTTHSPLILNYIEDTDAKDSIVYLYKNDRGYTQAIRLFSIPSMKNKLKTMGPGEAFADTDLSALQKQLSSGISGE